MKKLLRIIEWIVPFALLLVLLSFVNKAQENTPYKKINVSINYDEGHYFVKEEDILKIVRNETDSISRKGRKEINIPLLEEIINAHPSIKKAEVYSPINGALCIEVSQRKPIARVWDDKEESYYIDSKGEKMMLSDNYSAPVLLVRGTVDDKNYDQVFHLAQLIAKDAFLKTQVTGLSATHSGNFTLFPKEGPAKVFLGHAEHAAQKLEKLKVFYTKVPVAKLNTYKTLNINYTNQVVCTRK